ncbi:MAG: hypothetical protein E7219_02780 [Clostridiales bacterium]|nr:hypothetical protein [Clostridiales bacterium]
MSTDFTAEQMQVPCQGCLTDIVLTEDEVTVLGKFAQIPFLPVASDGNGDPGYLKQDIDQI